MTTNLFGNTGGNLFSGTNTGTTCIILRLYHYQQIRLMQVIREQLQIHLGVILQQILQTYLAEELQQVSKIFIK